ncbi:unnamed protein product [Leptosia nina]|uniref:Uncharacterized protein n=1 Tax=Leptosia nina TaxID=320188 RepID=A0AAV1JHE3_9NEOP
MSLTREKPDLSNENLNLVCRACLSTTGIFKNMLDWGLAIDFYKITNIMLHPADTISKSLCIACEEILTTCMRFKRQAEESDSILKEAINKQIAISSNNESNELQKNEENDIQFVIDDNKIIYKVNAPNMDTKLYYTCPFSCNFSCLKQTQLLNHLKMHDKHINYEVEVQFYCSYTNCAYHVHSGKNKYFPHRKALNQHTNKVHSHKIICRECNLTFTAQIGYNQHLETCRFIYCCEICDKKYPKNESLMVHLMRHHPEVHKKYKKEKAEKRKSETSTTAKKHKDKVDVGDSPKRSPKNVKSNVLLSWQPGNEISTQTQCFDLPSPRSQTSENESFFFSETVSLSDIQTQTIPIEFGLNKETITSQTQLPDLSIKETQTCLCLYDSQTRSSERVSPNSNGSYPMNCISTETQTLDFDELLRHNSAETQTSFDDLLSEDGL